MPGLYIHVPFCKSKCYYCDFYSLPRISEFAGRFVDAIGCEWRMRRDEVADISTIYIGGGTPSALSLSQMERLVSFLPQLPEGAEFTVEVNPEDVTADLVDVMRNIGINRVSMGVQSLNDSELRAVGRRHSATRAMAANDSLRKHFDNISLDVILGLPGQTVESLTSTLHSIADMQPRHVSVYILSYEEGTRLWSLRKTGRVVEQDEETIAAMYMLACDVLRDAGYEHYEISNFALTGFRARHNSSYWKNQPYLGLGPAAHSYTGSERRYNPSDVRSWLDCIESGRPAYIVEPETETDRINNTIMVSLRTSDGLDLTHFQPTVRDEILRHARTIPADRLTIDCNRLRIPEAAWLVSDDTISRLFL